MTSELRLLTVDASDPEVREQVRDHAGTAVVLERAREVIARHAAGAEVHECVRIGDPRDVLIDLGTEAAEVVIGSRGRGPVRSLLLGSVGVSLSRHATCPVVVHRPGTEGRVHTGVVAGVVGDRGADRAGHPDVDGGGEHAPVPGGVQEPSVLGYQAGRVHGGIGAAVLGWLADRSGIELVYQVCAWLPAIGLLCVLLPDLDRARRASVRARAPAPAAQRGSGWGPVAVTSRWGTQSSTWWNPAAKAPESSSTESRSERR